MGALEGKAIVITGSGQGIGAEYARAAAAEGASVIVNDIDPELADATADSIRLQGHPAVSCVADVSNWVESKRLVSTCVQEFGRIDGLVNNAGIQVVGPPEAMHEDDIRRLIEINVLGTIFCGTHAIVAMTDAGGGSIVNVTSGAHMGLHAYSIYGASKGAISSLTYCWALDMAGSGVRVNAVSPRAATGMAHDFVASLALSDDERAAKLTEFPSAASNAPVVLYLLSDRSSALHGQTVRIDGPRLSVVGKPAVQAPELVADDWSLDAVAAAFDGPLAGALMPAGLVHVTGNFRFVTHKSNA